jgi:hypothetical protein
MAQYISTQNPTYQPALRTILSITQANPALVTTTFDGLVAGDHGYETGWIVRIRVPYGFGMTKLDEFKGAITVVNATQFSIPIDTTNFDPFVVPPLNPGGFATPAQSIPIGEVAELLTGATKNVLPYP